MIEDEFPSTYESWKLCRRGDLMLDFLRRRKLLRKDQAVQIAVQIVERALGPFEQRYPNDEPREALSACQMWLSAPGIDNSFLAAKAGQWSLDYAYGCVAADAIAPAQAAYYLSLMIHVERLPLTLLCLSVVSDLGCEAALANYVPDAQIVERAAQAAIIRSIIPDPFA